MAAGDDGERLESQHTPIEVLDRDQIVRIKDRFEN